MSTLQLAALIVANLALVPALALGDLFTSYRHNATLYSDRNSGDVFRLHWEVDWERRTVSFAVNVSTYGWVGLGLSPLPGSDVVVGWVRSNGDVWFDDCFASETFDPNRCSYWYLTGGREVEGFTILEFRRQLDFLNFAPVFDVIWSWGKEDPVSSKDLPLHTHRGSAKVNLFGITQVLHIFQNKMLHYYSRYI